MSDSNFNKSKIIKSKGEIVVIDDEPMILDLLTEILTSIGYSVTAFSKSNKFLEFYHKNFNKIDLIIMDYTMPEIDGKELFKKIKEIYNTPNVYLLSGHSQNNNIDYLLAQGVLGFIQKPVTFLDLSTKVEEAIS